MRCGVSQDPILSPRLFAVFVDDTFNKKFNSHIVAYADDIKLVGGFGKFLQADTDRKQYNENKC